MKHVSVLLALLCFFACATQAISIEQARADERLPTSEEVVAHVRSQWDNDYGLRFARFASRPSQKPALISVADVSCVYYVVTPQCSFEVVASFSDGVPHHRRMTDQFGWTEDGKLTSVIVMYERRR